MFKVILILLLKITLAMFPFEEYGEYLYSPDEIASSVTPVTENPTAREQLHKGTVPTSDALQHLRGNIQKVLAGRILPSDLPHPTRKSIFEDIGVVVNTQADIHVAIPAPEEIEHFYIATKPRNPTRYYGEDDQVPPEKNEADEAHRIEMLRRWMPVMATRSFYTSGINSIEVARQLSSADPSAKRKRTTTTTTTRPTPVCTDEHGYRIRCANATRPSTTTLRSRRRRTRLTKRTKKSRKTTTPTTTVTTTVEPTTTPFDPNMTTINMTGLNTTTFTTTTPTTTVTTTTTTTESDTTESTMTTKRTRRLPWSRRPTISDPNDIDKILMILDNLTYIYDTNLVERMNETLVEDGYPYCPTRRTRTTTTISKTWPITEETGTVKAKCFVCGMDVPGIPQESQCADAFAPDYLPGGSVIAPRTHVDRYKKHCRYLDMPTWHVNGTEGRSMWGKWDGGCSVRWVDLSGVYTQRSCRARHKPAIGKHFVSKRLAKMEYALNMMDNGCIGSAQASLVPFSRGISLYARFYACVCKGTYCNRAVRLRPLQLCFVLGFVIAVLR